MTLREEFKRVSKINEPKEKEDSTEFIIISIDNKYFAIELNLLSEVVEIKDYVEFPLAPSYIKGLQFVRGNIIILFDVSEILEGKSSFPEKELIGRIAIVIKYKEDYFGVIVENLIDTHSISKNSIIPIVDSEVFYKGTFKFKDKTVSILSIEKIIQSTYETK